VEQDDVLWVPVRVALDAFLWEAIRVVGVDVLMLHVSNRLGASSAPPLGIPIYLDINNAGTMMQWEVEAITLRQAPPALPRTTEVSSPSTFLAISSVDLGVVTSQF
jgi:hypothetical protein